MWVIGITATIVSKQIYVKTISLELKFALSELLVRLARLMALNDVQDVLDVVLGSENDRAALMQLLGFHIYSASPHDQ